ncbi:hypothetical protein M433DRAFT_140883 [Acidomyces richmondensis BFW]|nr:MAG: hypothetical protein FE78DRAFT_74709 [Acidomyces sp. 'richmondensis']KYG48577.1 hypothetical protein M433DRAFT_140883 [Acidomyces richmondensis BFW]
MGDDSIVSIAIIGAGHIGQRHAQSVVCCPTASLLCLVDPSPAAQLLAAKYNVSFFQSVGEMLRSTQRPKAAIICTPNSSHVDIGKELLQSGIDILVEKPISTSVESGLDLIHTAKKLGRKILVGHHRRFNPYIAAAKQVLLDNLIGNPIALSGLWAAYKPPSYFASPFGWRKKVNGGGPVLINFVHEADTLQYLCGPIVRVHAEQTKSQRNHEVEEGAAILLRFNSGVVGTFILSDAAPSSHNLESATGENPIIPKTGADIYRIFGTEGTLSVGDMKITTHDSKFEKSWMTDLVDKDVDVDDHVVPFDEQIKHFVKVVKNEEAPKCSGEDGVSAVMVCDAIKRAMAEGKPVNLELL